MKLNSVVLFRCHIQVFLLRSPQFTCALHLRAKFFFFKLRGPKLGCALDSRKYGILPTACQYIGYSLMMFIVDNQIDFPTNAWVHSLDTRNKKSIRFTYCKFILCSERSFILQGQNLF